MRQRAGERAHADRGGRFAVHHRARRQDGARRAQRAGVKQQPPVQRREHVSHAHQRQRMALAAAGRHVQRRGELRIAAGVVQFQPIALHPQSNRHAAGIAAFAIFVSVIGVEVFAVGDGADNGARLLFGVVEDALNALQEIRRAEAGDNLVDLAFSDVDRSDLRFEIAPVLFRHAHVQPQDTRHILVQFAVADNLQRRNADALLHDIGQGARQRGGHRAADIGVVNMADHEAEDVAAVKDRLPDMNIGGMSGDVARIGVVGNADVAFVVMVDQRQHRRIVDAAVPGRAEAARRGERQPVSADDLAGEILRLFDKGRVRGAHQGKGHGVGRRRAVVGEYLQITSVNSHDHFSSLSGVINRLPKLSTSTCMRGGTQVVQSSCATITGPRSRWPGRSVARSTRST